jgi:hypothetical protein
MRLGHGVPRDFVEASPYSPTEPREHGSDQPGRFRYSGDGVSVGYEKGHKWLRLAISDVRLQMMYEEGKATRPYPMEAGPGTERRSDSVRLTWPRGSGIFAGTKRRYESAAGFVLRTAGGRCHRWFEWFC